MTTLAYSYSESIIGLGGIKILKGYGYTGTHENESPINISSLKEHELTNFCMKLSEPNLAEVWEHEDDEYWASFLKD